MGLHLDVNYNFKTEGYLQIAKAVEPFDMTWLEIDTWDPQALALIRAGAVPDRVLRVAVRPAPVPPLPRRLFLRRRDCRRDLERLPGVDQDRGDGRGV